MVSCFSIFSVPPKPEVDLPLRPAKYSEDPTSVMVCLGTQKNFSILFGNQHNLLSNQYQTQQK